MQLYLLLWLSLLRPSRSEYFSATAEMSKALDVGQKLAADLDTYLNLEETRLNRIRQVAKRLSTEGITPQISDQPEDFFGNPVNAYLTVKRLAMNWKSDLLSLLEGVSEEETSNDALSVDKQQLAQVRHRVEESASLLPGDSDLSGAADAILRLQETYQLSADRMAHGHLTDDLTCPRLSAAQCMHLGQQAYEKHDFLRAEEWFRVAYNRLWEELHPKAKDQTMGDDSLSREKRSVSTDFTDDFIIPDEQQPTSLQLLDHLAYSLGRQGRYAEALNVTRIILEEEPENRKSLENVEFYQTRINIGEGIIGPATLEKTLSKYDEETQTYQALCRGEQVFPPPPINSMNCRYYVPNEYYLIGPVKEEVLFPDPRLVMWYDVLHPGEIEELKQLAIPRLRRATVKNPVTGKLEFAFYRTSKSAWLPYKMNEITQRMKQRISSLTGLAMETAEDLQVGNYGIGGHYAPHFDFGRKREKDAFEVANGNRIATIIFYMTDLKAGGGTVFNRLGASVSPIRGAAGFWYNLYPSGEGDLRTRHVACPVLVGSKWVMNVWFHERGQEFRRPCGLTPDPIETDDGF